MLNKQTRKFVKSVFKASHGTWAGEAVREDAIVAAVVEALLTAVHLRVTLGPEYRSPNKTDTIDTVFHIISNPAGKDFLDQLFDEYALRNLNAWEDALPYYRCFSIAPEDVRQDALALSAMLMLDAIERREDTN